MASIDLLNSFITDKIYLAGAVCLLGRFGRRITNGKKRDFFFNTAAVVISVLDVDLSKTSLSNQTTVVLHMVPPL